MVFVLLAQSTKMSASILTESEMQQCCKHVSVICTSYVGIFNPETAVICNCKIFLQAQHIENYFMYLFISEFGKLDNRWRSFSGMCSSFINCRI